MLAHLARLAGEPGLALHAGCGVGKTVVTGTHVVDSLFDRLATQRWLVVAPKAVAEDTWQREFGKWAHLACVQPRLLTFEDLGMTRVQAAGKAAGLEFEDRKETKAHLRGLASPVHVCSYEAFPWVVKATGVNFPYDGLVLDESTFVKSTDSLRYKAAKHVVRKLGLVRETIELTGLSIPRGYEDLLAQFIILDGGQRLGASKTEFRDRWQEPDVVGRNGQVFRWRVRNDKLAAIQSSIGELAASFEHNTGIEVYESLQYVTLPPKARRAYDDMEATLLAEVDGQDVLSANAAVKQSKLLQMASGHVFDNDGASHVLHTAKLEAVLQAIEAATGPVMLAYAYSPELAMLRKALGSKARVAGEAGAVNEFRSGKLPVLLFHPETVAYGVDGFQDVCDTLFWFGAVHRYDWYHQAMKRLDRSGQRKDSVYVRIFVADNTIEEGVYNNVLVPRGRMNDGLMQALKDRRTR
jgi:hypothetical protein